MRQASKEASNQEHQCGNEHAIKRGLALKRARAIARAPRMKAETRGDPGGCRRPPRTTRWRLPLRRATRSGPQPRTATSPR
eukprot:10900267-Alexandrium_andersonii.AAC.1